MKISKSISISNFIYYPPKIGIAVIAILFFSLSSFSQELAEERTEFGGAIRSTRNMNHPAGTYHQDLKKGVCIIHFYSLEAGRRSKGTGMLINNVRNSREELLLLTNSHIDFPVGEEEHADETYLSFDFDLANTSYKGTYTTDPYPPEAE